MAWRTEQSPVRIPRYVHCPDVAGECNVTPGLLLLLLLLLDANHAKDTIMIHRHVQKAHKIGNRSLDILLKQLRGHNWVHFAHRT